MTPDRFRQIEDLYHAARECTGERRAELLAQANSELRCEVESLLAERMGGDFLERPPLENVTEFADATVTVFAVGAAFYRIESKLGEGAWVRSFEPLTHN
jgi:hypothetical protein